MEATLAMRVLGVKGLAMKWPRPARTSRSTSDSSTSPETYKHPQMEESPHEVPGHLHAAR